jgi:beta-lactam-binding protein with PASTA domain
MDNRCLDVAGGLISQVPGRGAGVVSGTTVNLTESNGLNSKGKPGPLIA